MGEKRNAYRIWWEGMKERNHLKDAGVDGRILKWNFKKQDRRAWTGSIWLRIETSHDPM